MIVPGVDIIQEDQFYVNPNSQITLSVARPGRPSPFLESRPVGGVNLPSQGNWENPLDHVNPTFGGAVFILAGLIKLHPAFKWPAFLIGGGGAVINYGSETAGAEAESQGWAGGGGGGF